MFSSTVPILVPHFEDVPISCGDWTSCSGTARGLTRTPLILHRALAGVSSRRQHAAVDLVKPAFTSWRLPTTIFSMQVTKACMTPGRSSKPRALLRSELERTSQRPPYTCNRRAVWNPDWLPECASVYQAGYEARNSTPG